jgi:phosphatidylinositol dimannoside acyltransferase
MSRMARLRSEARDLLELVLIPGLAAVLPWPLCFRIFRWLCQRDFLYREACHEALAQAQRYGWVPGDASEWLWARRLVTLVDHADLYLVRTRSNRWLARYLSVRGTWPDPRRPAILCTFHWGAGMWSLRHAVNHGMRAHAVIARHTRATFPGQTVRFLYYGARIRAVADTLGRRPVEIGTSPRQLLNALRAGEQILAAVDVPSDQVAASQRIELIGLPARMPRGLFRVAAESGTRMTVFLVGIGLDDGRRTLRIHQLRQHGDTEALMAEAFSFLDDAIRAEPAVWHFWQIAPRVFEGAAEEGIG